MSLPYFQTQVRDLSLLQTGWASQLNPIVNNSLLQGNLLQSVKLASGSNAVNHKLGKNLTGWILTRIRTPGATIYDTQDANTTPSTTLQLHASAAIVVDIYVF
jgi:hypothetical protein